MKRKAKQKRSGNLKRVKTSTPSAGTSGPPARPAPASFPIVVIGASAGGLEAFTKFLAHMTADSGMALVLIPHLDPTHKSLMVELLARQTAMPVFEAEHRMPIRPNTVYIIPPNKYLAMKAGRLILSPVPKSHAGQTPIDFALRSLAEDQKDNAIGIVLSGTGSHGTAGLKEIKLAGGLVLVQDPTTAEHDQMPRSALEAGIVVDYVLAPEKMPDVLIAYARRASRRLFVATEVPDAGTLAGLDVILGLLEARTKHNFHHYRKNMILRRIQRRMLLLRTEDIRQYIERLRQDADELTTLRRDLSIGVTEFFREPAAFEALATRVLPKLIRHASADAPIRVWIPACSTGEEAYSIAILFMEQFKAAGKEAYLQMFASDISEESLKIARRGIYSESIVDSVSPERLEHFFVRIDVHRYQVSTQLRGAIVFAPQNLISDPPFSRLDLISCRNALIYLEPDIQAKVISLLHYALNKGGYLLLGPAESIGPAGDLFEAISRKWRIYRRTGPVRHELLSIPITASSWRRMLFEQPAPVRKPDGVTELMQKLLLSEFTPAAVLVNDKYEILSVQGPVVNYVEIPPGKLTRDLMAMAREPLRARIRATCHKALREDRTVRDVQAQVLREGHYLPCSISVRPVTGPGEVKGLLLIVFEDRAPAAARSRRRGTTREHTAMRLLEDELRATRDDLQRTVGELESSNEDLKASNEEVMSMNEELQCANEELETSKEELQSLNEDLSAVNSQLESKVNDLNTTNNDLTHLIAATDIAIVFLDRELHIKRFTAPAAKLLSLLAGDVGRSFCDFVPKLTDGGLAQECHHVITTGIAFDKEIVSDQNRCYLRRILPYRAGEGAIVGVVVVFIDVTERVEAEAQIRAILDATPDAVVTIDVAGKIVTFNQSAVRLFGYAADEVIGQNVSLLMPPGERAQHDSYLNRYRQTHEPHILGKSREVNARRKDGTLFPIRLSVTQIEHQELFAGFIHDMSAARTMQEEILNIAMLEQQRIGQELHDGTQQELTGLGLLSQTLHEALSRRGSEAEATLAGRLADGIAQANLHVRSLAHGLVPVPVDEHTLPAALGELASNTRENYGLSCRFDCPEPLLVDDPATATHLYRIAQEAVGNAVKHAKANAISIRLAPSGSDLLLEIQDDGVGIAPRTPPFEGAGLRLMEHRCSVIGGRFTVQRQEGGGTLVACAIPRRAHG